MPSHGSAVSFFVQARSPHNGFAPFKTHIIDLEKPVDALFSNISSNGRYKIKRAEREGVLPVISVSPSSNDVTAFADFFDEFARQKSLAVANRAKLTALAEAQSLIVSSASDQSREVLVMHAYVHDREIRRVRLLYSASHFRGSTDSALRNAIGRANRLLHWYEIEGLRSRGYLLYDLGGIPMDDSDAQKNAIARFKREFGGREVVEFNGFQAHSLLGSLVLMARRNPL